MFSRFSLTKFKPSSKGSTKNSSNNGVSWSPFYILFRFFIFSLQWLIYKSQHSQREVNLWFRISIWIPLDSIFLLTVCLFNVLCNMFCINKISCENLFWCFVIAYCGRYFWELELLPDKFQIKIPSDVLLLLYFGETSGIASVNILLSCVNVQSLYEGVCIGNTS